MNRLFLVSALFLALSGCGLFGQKQPKTVIVTETKYIYPSISEAVFEPCVPKRPLAKELYVNLNADEREKYLGQYLVSVMGKLKTCNTQLGLIKERYNDRQP